MKSVIVKTADSQTLLFSFKDGRQISTKLFIYLFDHNPILREQNVFTIDANAVYQINDFLKLIKYKL